MTGEPRERRAGAAWTAAASAIILLTLLRVAATHRVFSQITDEPVHIAAGRDWWRGELRTDVEHPPLARLFFGFPFRTTPVDAALGAVERGNALLWNEGDYRDQLAAARRGNLPFLALLLVSVWLWAKREHGPKVAVLALLFTATLPPILGHAGVATTDLACAATLTLALYALTLWLDEPAPGKAVLLGVAVGLGVGAKLSFLLFFVVGAVVLCGPRARLWAGDDERRTWRPAKHLVTTPVAIAVAVLVVVLLHRFQPQVFLDALNTLRAHNTRGHEAYLFGRVSRDGWWYYFPVALFFKTPLALLVLVAIGTTIRAARTYSLIAMALLLAVMPASINIGVRHVLVLYPLLAMAAALAFQRTRAIAGALAVWLLVATSLAHPDYLAYFNEAAGREPGRILADSNLDWGQDVLRLAQAAREQQIVLLGVHLFGSMPLARAGLPPLRDVDPWLPSWGWIAVSETVYRIQRAHGAWQWIEGQPYQRIGTSIRLYHLP